MFLVSCRSHGSAGQVGLSTSHMDHIRAPSTLRIDIKFRETALLWRAGASHTGKPLPRTLKPPVNAKNRVILSKLLRIYASSTVKGNDVDFLDPRLVMTQFR